LVFVPALLQATRALATTATTTPAIALNDDDPTTTEAASLFPTPAIALPTPFTRQTDALSTASDETYSEIVEASQVAGPSQLFDQDSGAAPILQKHVFWFSVKVKGLMVPEDGEVTSPAQAGVIATAAFSRHW
jgi:hypothetical protein